MDLFDPIYVYVNTRSINVYAIVLSVLYNRVRSHPHNRFICLGYTSLLRTLWRIQPYLIEFYLLLFDWNVSKPLAFKSRSDDLCYIEIYTRLMLLLLVPWSSAIESKLNLWPCCSELIGHNYPFIGEYLYEHEYGDIICDSLHHHHICTYIYDRKARR